MTTINVSTASQLAAAIASAKAGDVIVLADGDYGSVSIDRNFSDYVTIEAANPLGAKFDQISISGSSYIKLDGVHVDSASNGGPSVALIGINGSDHIMVVNSEVNGKVDTVYPISGYFGIRAEGCSYVTISNNDVHDVLNGIANFSSGHLTVTENFVDRVGADYFKFGNIDNALVENNTGGGHTYADADAHEDFMQFQGEASSNVTIRGNVFLAQNVTDVQGIFVSGDGGHSNILIEDNIIYTGMANGIYVADGSTGVVIRDNTLIAPEGEVIRVISPNGATESNNLYSGRDGETAEGSNYVMQTTDSGDANYYQKLFPDLNFSGGVSLSELTPKAGTAAATKGAWDRLADLLDGNSGGGGSGSGDGSGGGGVIVPPEPDAADLLYSLNGDSEFNGTTAAVVKTAHKGAFETAAGSVSLTFDADTVSGRHALVSKDANGYVEGGNHMTILVVNGELRAWFEDGDSGVRLSVGGIKANTEYDVMATFDDDTVSLYLNGKLVDSDTFVMNWEDNEQTLLVGGSGRTSTASTLNITNAFDGTISDVQIWGAAMTPSELALLA